MDGLRAGLSDLRASRERKELLKRQIEQDKLAEDDRAFDRSMKTKQIELAERGERRARDKMIDDNARGAMDDVLKEIAALQQRQESAARIKLLDAQAAATAAKPSSPIAAQLDGIEDFSSNFASALDENQQAIAAMQNPALQQDPAAFQAGQQRVLKAQIRLSALQQMSQNWGKSAGKESTVRVKMPSEDGRGEATMDIPASQWNQSHPLWKSFNTVATGATKPAGAADQIPTLTPEQASAAKPGTKFRTTDGRILVR